MTKVEQPIKDQAAEGQSLTSAGEGSANEVAATCDATTPQQSQSGDQKQQAEPQALNANEATLPSTGDSSQPALRPNSQAVATNNQLSDPVEAEPYRWHECTVGINITLIPDPTDKAHYQTAIVGIRTHNDAPIVRRVAAGELLPLPSCIMEMVREMREQLPARAEHREERMARAKQTAQTAKQSAAKTQPAKGKVKPGRYVSASAQATTAAVEQESFDDGLFSTQPVSETVGDTAGEAEGAEQFARESQEEAASAKASEGAVKQSTPPRSLARHKAPKYDKHGRALDSKSSSTPKNQMSLI